MPATPQSAAMPGYEAAALEAMDTLKHLVLRAPWEYGAMVCRKGNDYFYTDEVTDNDAGRVSVIAKAGPKCVAAGALSVADVHLHPWFLGQPTPSGDDLQVADTNLNLCSTSRCLRRM